MLDFTSWDWERGAENVQVIPLFGCQKLSG
jgi:hypothetical protein